MQPGKSILLAILVLSVGIIFYLLFQGSGPETPEADASGLEAAGAVSGEVGEETAQRGVDATRVATDLITKKLVLFILGGIAAGVLLMVYVVPAAGDAISTFFYSADEEIAPDASSLAVAKVAQGDYEGAIAEYKKLIEENPNDRFPVIEIAKLYLEKLNNPGAAIDFLEERLNDKEWPVDDAAFMMFRIVDIEVQHRGNPARARELLGMIIQNFEGSRHAANAEHKIEEIDAATGA